MRLSPACDGRDEYDAIAIAQDCGRGDEFVVHRGAHAIRRQREVVTGAQFVVKRSGSRGGGRKFFLGEATLFAEDGEILNREMVHVEVGVSAESKA